MLVVLTRPEGVDSPGGISIAAPGQAVMRLDRHVKIGEELPGPSAAPVDCLAFAREAGLTADYPCGGTGPDSDEAVGRELNH